MFFLHISVEADTQGAGVSVSIRDPTSVFLFHHAYCEASVLEVTT